MCSFTLVELLSLCKKKQETASGQTNRMNMTDCIALICFWFFCSEIGCLIFLSKFMEIVHIVFRILLPSRKMLNFNSPATTRAVATKESMALAYWGWLSERILEVRRQSIVATPSIAAPRRTGT